MSIEEFALTLLLLPVAYEILALLSHRLAFIPRLPSYSQMTWRRTDHWPQSRRIVVAVIVVGLTVAGVAHLLWGWIRGID